MKLPFVDALETTVLGRTVNPLPPPFIEMRSGEEAPQFNPMPDWLDYETKCTIGFRQTAPATARDQVRRDTIRAITHHLYGDVRRELINTVLELRAVGVPPDADPLRRLESLIETLSP